MEVVLGGGVDGCVDGPVPNMWCDFTISGCWVDHDFEVTFFPVRIPVFFFIVWTKAFGGCQVFP